VSALVPFLGIFSQGPTVLDSLGKQRHCAITQRRPDGERLVHARDLHRHLHLFQIFDGLSTLRRRTTALGTSARAEGRDKNAADRNREAAYRGADAPLRRALAHQPGQHQESALLGQIHAIAAALQQRRQLAQPLVADIVGVERARLAPPTARQQLLFVRLQLPRASRFPVAKPP